ncbi:DMT family transporter [Lusitaniella coriacea LEGE 07157]|uniref:DMT family transporter n=1 Tax=Lusitaniella coriacea LEGE 07157 TaxID=945747 RepID=A0A8J7DU14_9CYAN|nr:DMT family transporter [Lusitaniella coriacea]MBE9114741.1 DMT family transporter [Lusitaniella coriacea LEGE 07157]
MQKVINRIPGRAYLLLAIIIFAASNSVTRKLTELGEQNLIDGRNPISFCNVLFVGNLCALVVLFFIYRRQCTLQTFKAIPQNSWFGLILISLLSSALAPALIFMALDLTAVNNVVLISRIEPPLILALSILILKDRVNIWVIAGAIISFVGVALTVLLQEPSTEMMQMGGLSIGRGELMAACGAIALAISTIISKVALKQIPLGIFSLIRTTIGTIVFFFVVIILYTPSHFMDVFSPFLWQWMSIYGAIIVVGGQLCWFAGLKTSGASDVSLASSFSPIAGILAAYLILSEAPTMAQYIGGSVILVGIVLNQIGVSRKMETSAPQPSINPVKEMEMEVGFKGI